MPKKYIPNDKEKYMCARQKAYFKKRLIEWRKEIIEINNKSLYLNDIDHEISSPDIIDQASSQTEKSVEMRTFNRQRKLLLKIEMIMKDMLKLMDKVDDLEQIVFNQGAKQRDNYKLVNDRVDEAFDVIKMLERKV